MHLDPQRLRAFLARPEAFPELVEHLATPCPQCEEVLAQASVSELEGAVDRSLLAVGPPPALPSGDDGFERVLAALRPRRRSWAAGAVASVGLLAAVAWALLAAPAVGPQAPTEDGVKGPSPVAAPLGLSVAARHADGSYRPVGDGDHVAPSATLVFQYDAVVPLDAELVVERAGREPERLGGVRLEAGRHELRSAGGVLAFTLDGEAGPLHVWLVGPDGSRAGVRMIVDP